MMLPAVRKGQIEVVEKQEIIKTRLTIRVCMASCQYKHIVYMMPKIQKIDHTPRSNHAPYAIYSFIHSFFLFAFMIITIIIIIVYLLALSMHMNYACNLFHFANKLSLEKPEPLVSERHIHKWNTLLFLIWF